MSEQGSEPRMAHGNHTDADYAAFLAQVQARFVTNTDGGATALFNTDAANLWDSYLDNFGPAPTDGEAATPARQDKNCCACRQFVERFGALVTVDSTGMTTPAIWHADDAPDAYKPAVAAMARQIRMANVTGVFLSAAPVWGKPETGVWRHIAVTPPAAMLHQDRVTTAFQASAGKSEDFKTVMRALNEFTQPHIEVALSLLKTDALYRSEKVLGQAEWLHNLHLARATAHGSAKANVVWRAIATAPAGFCHPRSSMIGTLLADIAAGKDFDEVSRAFAAKMHPLAYQRPQAAPSTGAIAAAEKLFQQLGAAGSLARRYARLEEVQVLWQPVTMNKALTPEGVFGHLKSKGAAALNMMLPAQTMTWDKFLRTVLPTAEQIEFCAPKLGSYSALVTAANADAPPILQWDNEAVRNPVSWYFWHGGSTAEQFGLIGGKFHQVNAITLKPCMWHGGHEHQGHGVLFVIDGAKDSRTPGACLFPEILKAEFHGVRSVLEAYSNGAKIEGAAEQSAAGVMLQKGQPWDALVRVTAGGKTLEYKLDRWD